MISSEVDDLGIAEVVMDNPPVNALTVAGWFELARIVRALGEDPAVRVVVLRAEGRGFNAGVDIKEMQQTEGFDALIGANRGCYAAFAAVYECAVPVIAAVNGYCLGGGIGLVGNADVIVASDDATFGLPEVDRGALGAATHLSRLVPQHQMRAMVYTSAVATAAELHAYGSVLKVVPTDELRAAAHGGGRRDRGEEPDGHPGGQGVAQRHRPLGREAQLPLRAGVHVRAQPLGRGRRAPRRLRRQARHGHEPVTGTSKLMSEDDVVGRLRSGMTIGIGGWGSRRKPMSLVRALLRSDLDDLHVVSYGGPDVGMLCAAGKVSRLTFAFVSLDSIPLEPHFRKARESGSIACTELDEGMVLLGLQAAAWRVPFLPSRVGLGSDLYRVNPELRTVRSPYPSRDGVADEELIAVPAIHLDAALCHLNVGDERGNAAFLGPDLYFDDLMLEAAEQSLRVGRADRAHRGPRARGRRRDPAADQPAVRRRRGATRPTVPTPRRAIPTTRGTRRSSASTRSPPANPMRGTRSGPSGCRCPTRRPTATR